jgi:hypothetical protein
MTLNFTLFYRQLSVVQSYSSTQLDCDIARPRWAVGYLDFRVPVHNAHRPRAGMPTMPTIA